MHITRRQITWAIAAAILTTFAVIGAVVETEKPGLAARSAEAAESNLKFVRWEHPSGLLSIDVPAGWRIEGEIGTATDLGQFKIQGYSPDGRSLFSLAHNWLSFMEFQYGPYRPGHGTIEAFVLPEFLKREGGYAASRVVYRSRIQRVIVRNRYTGLPTPFDAGVLGFLLQRNDGGFSAGTAFAETTYIASPGTPGLWRLRVFTAAIAPAEDGAQQDIRTVLDRAVRSLKLSKEFFALWHQAHDRTVKQMRAYSAQMDRVFSRYLASVGRSSSRNGRDPLDGWAVMMRGGQYAVDETTGEQYWISNQWKYWFVNDRGELVGNDTGEVPTNGGNWRPVYPVGS